MNPYADTVRARLSGGPLTARQLAQLLGVSQPTISRAVACLGGEVVRFGAARSIQYALYDDRRGWRDVAVYRVDAQGKIHPLGTLVPVRPAGSVMREVGGKAVHSDGPPWWLLDMRPQGYLGRAFAARHGLELGLPQRLADWSDTDVMRALLAYGHDVVGDLLLGDAARDRFIEAPAPAPISEERKSSDYPRLALSASRGEIAGSSAGGEQPKFVTYAMTSDGPRHVLVKFTEAGGDKVSERWRDLLLAEHLALETLAATLPAAKTRVLDFGDQRFLEVERFDRVGALGRRGLVSLAALDAEFVGAGAGGWPAIARRLAGDGLITREAADGSALLWAFGILIGNADMHGFNLSFLAQEGRPYQLAPAYDMSPMAMAPRSGGGLPDTVFAPTIIADVSNKNWRQAEQLARRFLAKVQATPDFSQNFQPCIAALARHIEAAAARIGRLG